MDSRSKADEQTLKDTESFIRQLQSRLDRGKDKELSEELRQTLQAKLNALRHAHTESDVKKLRQLLPEAEALVAKELGEEPKSTWREYVESIGLAILFALFLRGFVLEAFKIPTGSMIPTLLVGDHLFVNKFNYGIRVPFTQRFLVRFNEPKRGEVVVFTFPRESARAYLSEQPVGRRECIDRETLQIEKDFIKRIVGLPGDTVELRDNMLVVNSQPVKRTFLEQKTTGIYMFPRTIKELEVLEDQQYTVEYSGSDKNFGPVKIKPGHVFVMGDNRDNSSDSRCWGQVPIDHIKGRAVIIWWSVGPDAFRWDRIGLMIHEDAKPATSPSP